MDLHRFVLGVVEDGDAVVGGGDGERVVAVELDGNAGVVGAVDVFDRQLAHPGHQLDDVVAAQDGKGQCVVDPYRQVGIGGGEGVRI